jgi:hypothetical protein
MKVDIIKSLILENQCTYLRVYDERGTIGVATISNIKKNNEDYLTPEQVATRFDKMMKTLEPARYKIMGKRFPTDSIDSAMYWFCETYEVEKNELSKQNNEPIEFIHPRNQQFDESKLLEKARSEALEIFREEQKRKELDEIKKDIEDTQKELQLWTGKIAFVMESLFSKFMPKIMNSAINMNGMEKPQQQPTAEPKFNNDEVKLYNDSLIILANHFTANDLYKLALKVQETPELAQIILSKLG